MIRQITVREVQAKREAGEPVTLLDVRNRDEYAFCRIENSTLIPLPELAQRLEELDFPPDSEVVVYCHHGIRSLNGTAILQQAGYTNVSSMAGGIDAWSRLIDPTVPRY